MRLLREYIHILLEVLQSHTREPEVGSMVVNINPSCKHYQSLGNVLDISSLPNDAGKIVTYECQNSGVNWSQGDILKKTMDQLESYKGLHNENY